MRYIRRIQGLLVAAGVTIALASFRLEAQRIVPGSTAAQFSVSPDGGAAYSVPIKVPPGTASMEPKLALTYSSLAGPGPAGFGWSITGLSVIQRGARNLADEGVVRGIRFDERDALLLDGEKLVEIAASPGTEYREYRSRVDSLSRIRAYEWSPSGPSRFVVETRAGLRMYYGTTPASRVRTASGHILFWLCDRIVDRSGNYIVFLYEIAGPESRIREVSYTGNDGAGLAPYARVVFDYSDVLPMELRYVAGERINSTKLLTGIRTLYGNSLLRYYRLIHTSVENTRRPPFLTELFEEGADGLAYRPLKLTYTKPIPGWSEQQPLSLPPELDVADLENSRIGFRLLDLNGDGRMDIVYRSRVETETRSGAFIHNGSEWVSRPEKRPPVDLATNGDPNRAVIAFDANGNGTADLVSAEAGGTNKVFLSSSSGWDEHAAELPFKFVTARGQDEGFVLVDVDPAERNGIEVLWSSRRQGEGLAHFDGARWQRVPHLAPPRPFTVTGVRPLEGVYVLDADCNGVDNLIYHRPLANGTLDSFVYEPTSSNWRDISTPQLRLPFSPPPSTEGVRIADLDGDGCKDIFVSYESQGQRRQEAFLARATGWIRDTRSVPDVLFWKDNVVLGTWLADANGDGQADLLGGSRGQRGFAYLGRATEWELVNGLTPPAPLRPQTRSFAAGGQLAQLDSRLNLELIDFDPPSGPRGRKSVYSISADDEWTASNTYQVPLGVAQFDKVDLGVRFPDLNGDGLADLAFTRKAADGSLSRNAYLYKPRDPGSRWQKVEQFHIPIPTFSDNLKDMGIALVDFNGDGLVDILSSYRTSQGTLTQEAYVNCSQTAECKNNTTESSFWKRVPLSGLEGEPFADEELGPMGARFTDLNGDGLTDVLISRRNPKNPRVLYSRAFLNHGQGWRLAPGLAPPIDFVRPLQPDEEEEIGSKMRDNRVELMDLNSDRLPDLVFHFETIQWEPSSGRSPGPTEVLRGAYLNRGDHWEAAPSFTPPHRIDADPRRPQRQTYFDDINGDALLDLTYAERGRSETHLNTGLGWTRETSYTIPDEAISPVQGDQGFRLLDVNGDGLADLAYHYSLESGEAKHGTFLNIGIGWLKGPAEFDLPLAITRENRGDLGVRPLDLDGDGIVDLIQSFRDQDGNKKNTAYLNRGTRTGLLETATNGLGMRTSLEHRSLLGVDFNASDVPGFYVQNRVSGYPIIEAPVPGYALRRFRVQGPGVAARSHEYEYGGYRIDSLSGRSLGFAFQRVTDVERNRVTHIRYLQTEGLIGSTEETEVRQRSQRISQARQNWALDQELGKPLWNGFRPQILRPQLRGLESSSWDLSGILIGSQSDLFTYDSFANALSIDTRFGDGSGSWTQNTFADDPSKWLLGRLATTTVTLTAPNQAPQTRKATFAYSSQTGLLVQEVSLAGTDLELVMDSPRDRFGNVVETLSYGPSVVGVRRNKRTFDSQGRFALVSENALNHRQETSFDRVSGVVLSETDPNQLSTVYQYDSLQNLRRQETPDHAVMTTSSSFTNLPSDPSLVFIVAQRIGNLPETTSFYDAAGRLRLERSTGFRGQTIFVARDYDTLGRLERVSLPYFERQSVFWTETRFDALDRPVEEIRPDSTRVTRTYSGLTTTTTSPAGHSSKSTKNLRGRTVKTSDILGGVTAFGYDPGGNQISITNALGLETRIGYDLMGNRISLHDPSSGSWRYRFNAFGELVEQEDPRGHRTELTYDALGRLVTRLAPESLTTWKYDDAASAIGKLVSIVSGSSTKSFYYDDFGRLAEISARYENDLVTVLQSYDELSRPARRIYSTGLVKENRYDVQGLWAAVAILTNSEEFLAWEALDIDAQGRIVKERLGNGLITSRAFDPRNGRLEKIESTTPSGRVLQDLHLTYDLIGNVLKRADSSTGSSLSLSYDRLSRLTRVVSGRDEDLVVTYDPLGNILHKSDVGTYEYCSDSDRSNFLCRTRNTQGDITSLAYDRAGNVTDLGDRKITYNPDGRVVSIWKSRFNYASFSYGPSGELVRHESREGAVKYKTISLEDVEILREDFAPPLFPTPERTRIRNYIESPSGTIGYYEHTYWHFPMRQASPVYGDQIVDKPERSTALTTGVTYFLRDQLGSIEATLGAAAQVLLRFSYDPWGVRKKTEPSGGYANLFSGYTGHEHLQQLGLIHMGGRVFAPVLARFLSPDPLVQAPGYSQSHNRYSYAFNNPFGFVDPSGYFFEAIGNFFQGIGNAVGSFIDTVLGKPLRWINEQINKAGRWLSENWRTVAVIAATVVLSVAAPGIGAIAIGAITGGLQAALYGGTINDILKGAIIGAMSGALFAGAQQIGGTSVVGSAVSQGVAGGGSSLLSGGDFSKGFFTASISRGLVPGIENTPGAGYRVAASAVLGGAVAAIRGDRFEDGAINAAMARLFVEAAARAQGPPGRKLTGFLKQQAEIAFGDKISDYDSVQIIDGQWSIFQGNYIMAPDGNIYWPGFPECSDYMSCGASMQERAGHLGTFIHEMTHVMQYQSGTSVILEATPIHLLYKMGWGPSPELDSKIFYRTPSPSSLNVEHQGDWYKFDYCIKTGLCPVN